MVATPPLHALGLTLLHASWQAAFIVGLYRFVVFLTPGLSPGRRYAMGLVALVALMMAPAITFVAIVGGRAVPAVPAILAGTSAAFETEKLLLILDGLWAAGASAMLLRTAFDGCALRRLGRTALAPPEQLAVRFKAMAREFGVATARLRLSTTLGDPIASGLSRPIIYFPVSAVTGLTPTQIDAVLAHELAHLRRADFAWNLIQTIVEAVYFFHPAIWWLNREIRTQREWCCDDEAASWCGAPLVYADALHRVAAQRRASVAGLGMAFGGHATSGFLLERIRRILGAPARRGAGEKMIGTALPPICAAALLACFPGSTFETRSIGSTPRPLLASELTSPLLPARAPYARPSAPTPSVRSASTRDAPQTLDSAPVATFTVEYPVSPERQLADQRDAQHNEARMTPEFIAEQRARDAWITRNNPPPDTRPPDG